MIAFIIVATTKSSTIIIKKTFDTGAKLDVSCIGDELQIKRLWPRSPSRRSQWKTKDIRQLFFAIDYHQECVLLIISASGIRTLNINLLSQLKLSHTQTPRLEKDFQFLRCRRCIYRYFCWKNSKMVIMYYKVPDGSQEFVHKRKYIQLLNICNLSFQQLSTDVCEVIR